MINLLHNISVKNFDAVTTKNEGGYLSL